MKLVGLNALLTDQMPSQTKSLEVALALQKGLLMNKHIQTHMQ